MSKPVLKKNHWTSRVNECSVSKDARGDLNVPLRGGAENGEFAYIGQINEDVVVYKSGKLSEGELLLEVENLSISGLPLYDVQTVIKNCKGPVRLKTVRQEYVVGHKIWAWIVSSSGRSRLDSALRSRGSPEEPEHQNRPGFSTNQAPLP
ncbi:membrane-associated guanylate kinase, WW and PDZ domain-containing protein 1b isoform X1 [Lates japonicus]|uniref:Membrane-associated guanylate kinase, WW and PDZ domain-containing protein 1b isoform X1 n=1 Tax=Lates japonicus TaxID=270547 RepID=A0AAD3NBB6_LATJO|nr:membrane-associated guanylate kinase, WW and PDZ domain-containing protein 1b isoform X1 [Lates japonicus]